ncbi:MAG: hypothetical protein A2X94_16080 [Bdellovibrionales bacterium GWB1_55_8]|nr:MAG: hypothetical protein A2X94_16080 [Bdellovibrionales bacterium GWB1_55_8]
MSKASSKAKSKVKPNGKGSKTAVKHGKAISAVSSKPAPKGKAPAKAVQPAKAAKESKKAGSSLASIIKGALLGKKAPEKKVSEKKASEKKAAPQPAVKAVKNGGKGAPAHKALSAKAAPSKPDEKLKKEASSVPAKAAKAALAAAKGAKAKGASAMAALNSLRGGFDSEAVCREVACEGLSTSAGYCRLHYIKNWKKIKRKELILKEKKLNQYIEELVVKYPDKYIEAIRQDLANDKDFAKVIYDLDLDESDDEFDGENESMDALIDNIKRDFDDEGDAF